MCGVAGTMFRAAKLSRMTRSRSPIRPSCPAAALAAAGAVLLAASPTLAQEKGSQHYLTVFGWSLTSAHLGASFEPDYLGSNDYRVAPSGSITFSRHPGEISRFSAPDDGFNVGLIGDDDLSAGVVGRWQPGRDNHAHDLRGFKDLGGTVEAGGFANWWPSDWLRIRGEVRHGLGGHVNWAATLGADAVARLGSWVLSAGPRLSWADDKFTRSYFEVSPQDAARSPFGLQPFAPHGSFWAPGALATAEYRVSNHWSFTIDGDYRRLTGDAAASPIVARLGSKDQFSTSLSVRYAFGP